MFLSGRHASVVAFSALAFGCPLLHADVITLKSGYVIEGHVTDPEADPIYIEMPKGKIAVYKDMIESVVIGSNLEGESGADGEMSAPGTEGEADPAPVPVIDLRPKIESDEDAEKYLTEVTAELERIVLRPEEAAVGEEALEPVYVQALADVGARAVPKLREGLKTSAPQMGPLLLDALAKADPAEARTAAKDVLQTHEYPRAREKAVALVGEEKGPERDALLEQAAKDTVWYVRSAAYREMAKEESAAALGKLGGGLLDEDEDVRAEVKRILKERTGQEMEKPEELQEWVTRQAPIAATEVSKPAAGE